MKGRKTRVVKPVKTRAELEQELYKDYLINGHIPGNNKIILTFAEFKKRISSGRNYKSKELLTKYSKKKTK